MKRIFDICASFVGLLLLSPLFIFISVWIALDSPGGIFYRQIRVGKSGLDFKIFKFRSMMINSDKSGLLTIGGRDHRITKSGYFIRKYKIDELPQLINVLIGDMSLVGPRPEVRRYVNLYSKEQMEVLSVRPGITDISSIKYRDENDILGLQSNPEQYYVDVIMPDKLRLNIEYIHKRSLLSDIQLIFKTIFQR